MEIAMLSSYRHENLVSLVGFCDEGGEKILVYEYARSGSLDKLLHNKYFTWMQRLKVCLDAARGLKYLHHDVGAEHRVIHRDIKSSNILLDENWKAKISDFGLSKIGPANIQFTFLISNVCGTLGYVDPQYMKTGILTKESDVFSFGVVLFEVLCSRLACIECNDESRFLFRWAQRHCEKKMLDQIIDPNLQKQMNSASLNTFSTIAYQCIMKRREGRPTMSSVVKALQEALDFQEKYEEILYGWGNHTNIQTKDHDNETPSDEFKEDIDLSFSLESYLGKKLLVLLQDGWKLFGTLLSLDPLGNVVLEGVYERVIVGELYCDISLGLFVIRGQEIVLIGEMDLEKEELPSYMTRVSANEMKRAQKEDREPTDLIGSISMRKEMSSSLN